MRAVVYARRSTPDEVNVGQQVDHGVAACERQGWEVVDVQRDDGISAWKDDAKRPGWDAVMKRVRADEVDVIVARDVDRIARAESYDWVDLSKSAVRIADHGGKLLSPMEARIKLAIAIEESDVKSRRQLLAEDRRLEAGKPPRGGHRHFGYHSGTCCPGEGCPRPDARFHRLPRRPGEELGDDVCGKCEGGCVAHAIREDEAAVLRDLAQRWLDGEPMRSLVRDLRERDVPTVNGGEWRNTGLRKTLLSPRLAGIRVHRRNGEETTVRLKNWDPIFTDDLHARLTDADTRSANRRAADRYLLTGFMFCGREGCGANINGKRHAEGRRRYQCLTCMGNGIAAEPVEEVLWNAALGRSWERDRLGEQEAAERLAEVEAELRDVDARREELDDAFADRDMSRQRWARQTRRLSDRVEELERERRRLSKERDFAAGTWDSLVDMVDTYETATREEQRRVLDGVIEKVVLHPWNKGVGPRVDLSRLEVHWVDGEVERPTLVERRRDDDGVWHERWDMGGSNT